MSASELRAALDQARQALFLADQRCAAAPALGQPRTPDAIDPTTLIDVVDELTHSTIFLHQLLHHLRHRATRAADHPDYPDPVREAVGQFAVALRDTARLVGGAVKAAHQVREHARVLADTARGSTKCPECGEPAIRATPTDLTPIQRQQGIRASHAHRDRSQLCPIVGDTGYEPAQPVPLTVTL